MASDPSATEEPRTQTTSLLLTLFGKVGRPFLLGLFGVGG